MVLREKRRMLLATPSPEPGNFVAQSGWVHLSENVALTGTYTVNSGAVLSKVGSINAALAGGRLDAGAGTMTVAGLSGNGVLSASAGTMHFQDAFTVGETMGILANGSRGDHGQCDGGWRPPVLYFHGQCRQRAAERDADFRPH